MTYTIIIFSVLFLGFIFYLLASSSSRIQNSQVMKDYNKRTSSKKYRSSGCSYVDDLYDDDSYTYGEDDDDD